MKTCVLKYPGGKTRIAPWIISHIPKHDVYLEPFFGGGAVFFQKQPCHIETVNDIYGEVVNFFRVLRDNHEALARAVYLTPFGRQELMAARDDPGPMDDLERARRFLALSHMGFGSSQTHKTGFRNGQQSRSPNPAAAWAKLPESMEFFAGRLKMAQIECLPALELIKRYDTADVFIYCDPPYLPGTRKKNLYKHEMTLEDHEELLSALIGHPGKVMVSGYENETYGRRLGGWRKESKETVAECSVKRTETLWMNYAGETNRMGNGKKGVIQ